MSSSVPSSASVASPSPSSSPEPANGGVSAAAMMNSSLLRVSSYGQFKLLLWKNCLRKRRAWGHTICEFLVPLCFVMVLVSVRLAFSKTDVPQNYFEERDWSRQINSPDGHKSLVHTVACGCEKNLEAWYDGLRSNQQCLAFAPAPGTDPNFVWQLMNFVQSSVVSASAHFGDDMDMCWCEDNSWKYYNMTTYISPANNNQLTGMFRFFNSSSDLDNYLGNSNYDNDPAHLQSIDKAIIVTSVGNKASHYQWSYTIRTNGTDIPPTWANTDPATAYSNDTFTKYFYDSGLLTLQFLIDQYILVNSTGVPPSLAPTLLSDVSLYPLPEAEHISDSFAEIMAPILGLYLKLAFLWPFSRLVKQIVDEKERKIKEGLHMVGVNATAYMASWVVMYLVGFAVLCLIVATISQEIFFPKSSFALLFVYLYAFALSLIAFAVLLSSLFGSAKLAGMASPFILYAMLLPFFAVAGTNVKESSKNAACILPPCAFALGAVKIADLESNGVGASFANLWDHSFNFAMGTSIVWMFIDTGLVIALAWYVDKVVPKQYGVVRPWYFLFTRSYWAEACGCCGPAGERNALEIPLVRSQSGSQANSSSGAQSSSSSAASSSSGADGSDGSQDASAQIEPVDPKLRNRIGIRIRALTKIFYQDEGLSTISKMCQKESEKKKLTAVAGLNLDLYMGQLFVLLGHNGAGKTTTINMLTGMYPPSSGNASILGLDMTNDMDRIRQNTGVCPQHSVVWEELTVQEHLQLFGGLKGLTGASLDNHVATAIAEVGLEEKRVSMTKELSGGQNRRLSLAMALIGDSKIVFLDEPSSGVDPHSRRAMWSLLQKKKEGRIIILTTHFMDEADVLGDRIAILSRGRIKCMGSSIFLKRVNGVGYSFVVTKAAADDVDADAASSSSKKQQRASGAVGAVANWDPAAITSLILSRIPGSEQLSHSAGELTYRLPIATAGKNLPEMLDEIDKKKAEMGVATYGLSVTTLEDVFLKVAQEDEQAQMAESMSPALNYVAPQYSPSGLLLSPGQQAGSPSPNPSPTEKTSLLYAAAGNSSSLAPPPQAFSSLAASGAHEQAQHQAMMASLQSDQNEVSLMRQFRALLKKRLAISKRDRKAMCCQIFLPIILLVVGLSSMSAQMNAGYGSIVISLATNNQYNGPNYIYTNPQTNAYIARSLASNPAEGLNETLAQSTFPGMQEAIFSLRDSTESSHYGAYFGLDQYATNVYTLMTNITALFGQPTFLNEAHQALLRGVTGDSGAQIQMTLQPFDLTATEKSGQQDANGLYTSIIVTIAFSFIPASFAVFVVMERETNAKHLQMISGVGVVSYWLGNYVWDLLMYCIPATVSALILISNGNPNFIGENLPVVLFTLALYGASVIPFTYLASFLFSSHLTAQNVMILVYLIGGMGLTMVGFALYMAVPNTGKILRHFFRLLPNFCLGDCLFYMSVRHAGGFNISQWDMDISGFDLLYMALESVVYFAAVIFVEYCQSVPQLQDIFKRKDPEDAVSQAPRLQDESEDSDVAAERSWMQDPATHNSALIQLHGLRKTFHLQSDADGRKAGTAAASRVKVAVRNLWFSVKAGEVFGFLGQNGAGKTTTLKILTGDILPSKGRAMLHGFDLREEPQNVRKYIGYCPQFDSLHGLLTGEETLEFYARIRGIPERNIASMVNYLVARLQLRVNARMPVQGYSGGTKRKLSVGVALIGSPPIVFLDERALWNFISETMSQRAVVLTTHSMEEAEALSNRLGIIANGSLVCLGTAQHLKTKFGRGFLLELRVPLARVDEALVFLEKNFPKHKLLESFEGRLRIQSNPTEEGANKLTIAQIFRLMESHKEDLGIQDYSCGQTSLESIFIQMAKASERAAQQQYDAQGNPIDADASDLENSAFGRRANSLV